MRLLDGLLQAGWVQAGCERLRLPTRIRRLAIPAPATAPAAGAEGAPASPRQCYTRCCLAICGAQPCTRLEQAACHVY